jgi:hypothetical protein
MKIVALTLFAVIALSFDTLGQPTRANFWDQQKKGTNYFNETPTREWFESAANANIRFVRLTFEKWKGAKGDFLIGNTDDYTGLVEADFNQLLHFLNIADSLNLKVVLTPISLPGSRWVQNNNGIRDGKLWKDEKYHDQTCQYWKDLALRLKNHPAIVGFNIQNEPHPEIFFGNPSFWDNELIDWYQNVQGTPADLNLFYSKVISAIREVDMETPIIIEPGLYATPWAFCYLEKYNDPNIIYSFHMYEPYNFTTQKLNNGRYQYPGEIQIEGNNIIFKLSKSSLKDFLDPVVKWAKKNNVPNNRIWVGEFGCSRKTKGVDNYLSDLIEIFNENHWHWSFYAFREDVWDNMDYELGTGNVPLGYWKYSEEKSLQNHYKEIYGAVKNNPIWPIFQKEFTKN